MESVSSSLVPNSHEPEDHTYKNHQTKTLKIVLALNLCMFILEFRYGLLTSSTALIADSLDMLGDAIIYAVSIYVVFKSHATKATAALMKGGMMALFGIFVFYQAMYKYLNPITPQYEIIGILGLLALLVNIICFYLLSHYKKQDINMQSVWICSRNDIIANILVILAAIGILFTQSQWPDLIAGIIIGCLFIFSAINIIKKALLVRIETTKQTSPQL